MTKLPMNTTVSSSSVNRFETPSFKDAGWFGSGLSFSKFEYESDFRTADSSGTFEFLSIEMTGASTEPADSDPPRLRLIDRDLRTEPKLAKELRPCGLGAVPETEVGCLLGPKGKRDRNDRKAGMPDGVLEGGDGDAATERFRLSLLVEMLLVDGRGAEGIAEGKAPRLGCAGMDEGVLGERWTAMMKKQTKARIGTKTS
jgi:hypothetical protein